VFQIRRETSFIYIIINYDVYIILYVCDNIICIYKVVEYQDGFINPPCVAYNIVHVRGTTLGNFEPQTLSMYIGTIIYYIL